MDVFPLQDFVCFDFWCRRRFWPFLWVGGGFLVSGGFIVSGMGDLEEWERGVRGMLSLPSQIHQQVS